ncbi:MAG TPA: diguanylate cyclase, partial [Bacillota bacterium]|nr:diguanylate cyclase [Bacillota bacterium]
TNLIWASDEAFRIYGAPISDDNLIGLAYVQQTAITPDRKKLDKALKDLLTQGKEYNLNFRIIDTDDELHYIHSVATLIKDEDGNPKKVSGVIHDITKLKLEQDKLLYSSTHDHLTNVYNRRYFSEQRMLYDDEKYLPVSFAILDINGLKIINDSLGHHAGNEVLKRLAQVLERHITDGKNFVSRIGGDEFSIFFANTTHEQAEERMQHILDHLSHERIGNIELSIAYGIAVRETMDQSVDEVLKKAEDEMYLYKISDSQSVRNKIIDALLKTLYEKDNISEEHSQRVSDYAFFLAKACNLSNKRTNDIKTAGLLHDIGKIMISNDILNKEGKLTASEYNIIKTHPEKGYRIIHSIGDMDIIANHVHQHHE